MFRAVCAYVGIASFLLFSPIGAPTVAEAQSVSVTIGIGSNINSGRRITCAQGERQLRNRGFRNVRRMDCRGRHFVYRGDRRDRRYEIAIRASDGRIVDMRRIGRRR